MSELVEKINELYFLLYMAFCFFCRLQAAF